MLFDRVGAAVRGLMDRPAMALIVRAGGGAAPVVILFRVRDVTVVALGGGRPTAVVIGLNAAIRAGLTRPAQGPLGFGHCSVPAAPRAARLEL